MFLSLVVVYGDDTVHSCLRLWPWVEEIGFTCGNIDRNNIDAPIARIC